MTINNPLLKKLKNLVYILHQSDSSDITDRNVNVQDLIEILDKIFNYGLIGSKSIFWLRQLSYFHWMEAFISHCSQLHISLHYFYQDLVHSIRQDKRLDSDIGRGRLLLRSLLKHKMLSCPITVCRQHPELLVGHYCDDSIIGNEILLEIFSSLIAELDRLSISLDLENVDFLDKSLRVPLFRKYEFVPCRELGLAVRSIDGHMVVDDLDPEGVSAEDGRIEIGDVITSLFRRPLRRQPINIRSLLSLFDGKPVLADVIKARQPDGSLYQPIFNMLKENRCMDLLQRIMNSPGVPASIHDHLDEPPVFRAPEPLDSLSPVRPACLRLNNGNDSILGSSATSSHSSVKRGTENRVDNPKKAQLAYIGNINVGSNGGIGRLEWAILRMLDQCPDKAEYLPVSLTSGELGLTIREISPDSDEASQNNPPLLKHSFPQISAVGRRLESPLCLAYIAGDTTCTLSKRFTCHIFKAESSQYAQELVETIAQGFTRTHWAL